MVLHARRTAQITQDYNSNVAWASSTRGRGRGGGRRALALPPSPWHLDGVTDLSAARQGTVYFGVRKPVLVMVYMVRLE